MRACQYDEKINGRMQIPMKRMTGNVKLSFGSRFSASPDAARRLPPLGVMARSSAPPTPSSSLTRPDRMMLTISEITMNTNGMAGTMLAVISLSGGSQYCTRLPTTPISRPMPTAIGRLRSRAAMTAANAAAISSVYLSGSRPMTGAARMPASPASKVETTHTPAAMRDGLLPDSDVIASESTIARTLSPASVKRRMRKPKTTIPSTQAYAITWSSVTAVPNTW